MPYAPTTNPFSIDDLLRAHASMMESLTDDAGHFRRGGVGVFSETGLVHMAPPASRVPQLIADLFAWLASSTDHLLIRSCVFHYEFEFIHPFSDGNGRTGRLWQSLILGKQHPLFEHLPVENMVYNNQQAYYEAIAESSAQGQSGPFIDFMLGEILATLKSHQGDRLSEENVGINVGANVGITNAERRLLALVAANARTTAVQAAEALALSKRQAERLFASLRNKGVISRQGGNKAGIWIINK